jgi:alkaline phosphatase D
MSNGRIFLGPIIGAVNKSRAKIWFYGEALSDTSQKILCQVLRNGENIPESSFDFEPVLNTEYKHNGTSCSAYLTEISFQNSSDEIGFKIVYPNQEVEDVEETYSIKPFPEEQDKNFSFGLISCHNAFTSKRRHAKRAKMWGFLHRKMEDHHASFLIQCGDQVYCDKKANNAWKRSRNAENNDERLNNYRNVYFDSWKFEEVQNVMSTFPQFMIWDDHEITNGWGSKRNHFESENLAIFEAAKQAYYEFQHCHNPDPLVNDKFYYSFQYGTAAFLVMDLRGERDITSNLLMSDQQMTAIQEWLESDSIKQCKILFVVTSVPVFHLSRGLSSLGFIKSDIRDQWSYRANRTNRQKLLNALLKWSGDDGKPVFILGGDVHVGTEVCMIEENTNKKIYQITSSPITNVPSWLLDIFLGLRKKPFSFRLNDTTNEKMLAKFVGRHKRRNFGIIEVTYDNEKPKVMLYMYVKGKIMPRIKNLMMTCQDCF